MFLDIRLVFQENSHPEIRKTYFLAPKWGVDLYTGSTYTRVNTVSQVLTFCPDHGKAEQLLTLLACSCLLVQSESTQ